MTRPIRKKGIHRARKRGEHWIQREDLMASMITKMSQDIFYGPMKDQVMKNNVFYEMLQKDESRKKEKK